MPALHVDGNDLRAVHAASTEAVTRARAGGGPTFILADTYRWREHCGPNYDNDLGYRTVAEFEQWRERDPIPPLRATPPPRRRLSEAAARLMKAAIGKKNAH